MLVAQSVLPLKKRATAIALLVLLVAAGQTAHVPTVPAKPLAAPRLMPVHVHVAILVRALTVPMHK